MSLLQGVGRLGPGGSEHEMIVKDMLAEIYIKHSRSPYMAHKVPEQGLDLKM